MTFTHAHTKVIAKIVTKFPAQLYGDEVVLMAILKHYLQHKSWGNINCKTVSIFVHWIIE